MSTRGRIEVKVGSTRVLFAEAVALVVEIHRSGITLETTTGERRTVPWHELGPVTVFEDGSAHAAHEALLPRWEGLSDAAQRVALDRLEVVLETLTGYVSGFAALAQPGEPRLVGVNLTARCASMARQLNMERRADRQHNRRVLRGELKDRDVSQRTVLNWVRAYERDGIWGLVDGRAIRQTSGFDTLDPRFQELARAEVAQFDGDISQVRADEVMRRIMLAARAQGVTLDVPQKRSRNFISWLLADRGNGTRAHRSRSMRDTAGHAHYPAMRPGQVVAIDATRADVLVWDPLLERSYSVELITAIDVASRCIIALRVVPKSASATEACLLMYDVMRPFAVNVHGDHVTDWRWMGIPQAIEFSCNHGETEGGGQGTGPDRPVGVAGTHVVPGLVPDAIRCDHGSIFTGGRFTQLLNDLGSDLMLSRGTRPTDNPHIERWHETVQQHFQRIAGYKGRNPFERGRAVGKSGTDRDLPLLTAEELERQLRLWVAVEYNRSWHEGLTPLPTAPKARLSPIEMFDAYRQVTGRIDVPQHPNLIYQFLPIRWGTIQHDGVEFTNLTYDDPILDDFRNITPGTFRADDRKAPFFYDPRDVTRVWFQHPTTGNVYPINWRGAWRTDAPLTDKLLDHVRERIRVRGGNSALGKRTVTDEIVRELGDLTQLPVPAADRAMWSAARLRVQASQRDHLEAQLAAYAADPSQPAAIDSAPGNSAHSATATTPAPSSAATAGHHAAQAYDDPLSEREAAAREVNALWWRMRNTPGTAADTKRGE